MATVKFSKFAGILSAALSQHHLLGFEIAQLEFKLCFLYVFSWLNKERLLLQAMNDAEIHGLRKRGIQSRASDLA